MPIIGITSDTHCDHGNEFPKIDEDIDLLILAGDIGNPYTSKEYLDELNIPYIYISGNHESYGYDYYDVMADVFCDDVGSVERKTINLLGKKFHCCCLWTDLSNPMDAARYNLYLNDNKQIKNWNANMANFEFSKSIRFLEDSVREGDIVVTHHAPSFQSVGSQFKNNPINPSFASNLDSFILRKRPSIFIHGHMHDKSDYMIGDTRVICNPMGYPNENKGEYKIMKVEI